MRLLKDHEFNSVSGGSSNEMQYFSDAGLTAAEADLERRVFERDACPATFRDVSNVSTGDSAVRAQFAPTRFR